MRPLVLSVLCLAACTIEPVNPIDACETLRHDCCETNMQCLDFFGTAFPYCLGPSGSGTCSECATDDDCASGLTCDIDGDNFGVCW